MKRLHKNPTQVKRAKVTYGFSRKLDAAISKVIIVGTGHSPLLRIQSSIPRSRRYPKVMHFVTFT